MKKKYVLFGAVLLVLGIFLTIALGTISDYAGPEEVVLTDQAPYTYHAVPVKKDTLILVHFKSLKPRGQVMVSLLSEENYKRAIAGERLIDSDYLAKSITEGGELKWICTQDGNYYVVFDTPTAEVSKDVEQTITKESIFGYYKIELRVGSYFFAEFVCKDPEDKIRAFLINEDWFNMFREGKTVPAPQIMADASGNNGNLEWSCPIAGNYYLVFLPIAGKWPVPYTGKIMVRYVLEGSEWPLPLTYTIEGRREGPWYLGVIVIITGILVIILGFKRRTLKTEASIPPPAPDFRFSVLPFRP
ncbi:MAG: hypothetical protein QXG01_08285 [Candidatus Bathyarchaeia archaeon]